VNIQLEFTITDQTGTRTPDKKTVTMIVADGTMGRIRASAVASRPGAPPLPISLNVDARPRLVSGDTIQTEITVEYRPFVAALSLQAVAPCVTIPVAPSITAPLDR
jgi:hypothetical protein